jgi:hypothetical protein
VRSTSAQKFTIRTVPDLLRGWRRDPWHGFREAAKPIPELAPQPPRIATTQPAAPRAALLAVDELESEANGYGEGFIAC